MLKIGHKDKKLIIKNTTPIHFNILPAKLTEILLLKIKTFSPFSFLFSNLIPKYVTKHSNQISFALAKNEQTRNIFVEGLNKIGIDSRKPWTPIHMQPCNPELSAFHCNNAVEIFKNSLALPLFNNMKLSEAKKVINYFNKI